MGVCTAPEKMLLFCVSTSMRGSRNIELACLKKERKKERKKEEKQFGCFAAVWLGTFVMLSRVIVSLLVMKALQR